MKFKHGDRVYFKTSKWLGTINGFRCETFVASVVQYYVLFDGATKARWVNEEALMPELILKEVVVFT